MLVLNEEYLYIVVVETERQREKERTKKSKVKHDGWWRGGTSIQLKQ